MKIKLSDYVTILKDHKDSLSNLGLQEHVKSYCIDEQLATIEGIFSIIGNIGEDFTFESKILDGIHQDYGVLDPTETVFVSMAELKLAVVELKSIDPLDRISLLLLLSQLISGIIDLKQLGIL